MWRLVLASVFAVGAQAFAPIQWMKSSAGRFVIVPKGLPSRIAAPPMKLMLRDSSGETAMSADAIPSFSVRPDKTIRWDRHPGWCIEAAEGGSAGDVVRVNRCAGGPLQKWEWVPNGLGQQMIQLRNTDRCLVVADAEGGLNGAAIELRQCEAEVTDGWQFEGLPRPLTYSFSFWQVAQYIAAMVALGTMSVTAWLWRCKRNSRAVTRCQGRQPSIVDQGGVALAVPLHATENGAMLTLAFPSSEMAPAVMAVDPEPRTKKMPKTANENRFEFFVGALLKGAEETAKVMGNVAEEWVNSGWQVQKRAGSALPTIRPNAASVEIEATAVLAPPAVTVEMPIGAAEVTDVTDVEGALTQAKETSLQFATEEAAIQLQDEFWTFLGPHENKSYEITKKGEIVFESREAVTSLVAEFAYAKLKVLAASARALARYVNDLEGELEKADDEVVDLRKKAKASTNELAETKSRNSLLIAETEKLASELELTKSWLETQERAQHEAERAAERAVEQLVKVQTAVDTSTMETQEKMSAEAVRLEQELMAAETSATDLAKSKERLEASMAALQKQQKQVEEARRKEAERARELEQQAAKAEAIAEEKARTLSESESQVALLQAELQQLRSSMTTVSEAGTSSSSGSQIEAEKLAKEIDGQLVGTGFVSSDDPGQANVEGTTSALSRMRKDDLIAECKERGLQDTGTVAELRARLRAGRKRQSFLIDELVDRGWSEENSRAALISTDWDLNAALDLLSLPE